MLETNKLGSSIISLNQLEHGASQLLIKCKITHLATVTIFCRTPYIEVTPAPAAEGE